MLGLTACAMARAGGAQDVICTDLNANRLSLATKFGAPQVANPDTLAATVKDATGGYGVDAILELTGSPTAFEHVLPLARMGAAIALVGAVFPSKPVPLAMETVVRRNLRLLGIHNYAPADLQTAVRFLASNPQYPFDSLVERWYPLAAADEAFDAARHGTAIRVGVRPT
jgi:alcohol dehydrogenase